MFDEKILLFLFLSLLLVLLEGFNRLYNRAVLHIHNNWESSSFELSLTIPVRSFVRLSCLLLTPSLPSSRSEDSYTTLSSRHWVHRRSCTSHQNHFHLDFTSLIDHYHRCNVFFLSFERICFFDSETIDLLFFFFFSFLIKWLVETYQWEMVWNGCFFFCMHFKDCNHLNCVLINYPLNFFEPIFVDVKPRLMRALWRHLKVTYYPYPYQVLREF